MIRNIFLSFFLSLAINSIAQTPAFSRKDTLRGAITKEREWWDLTFYHLSMWVNPKDSTISGENIIVYKVLESQNRMQIDLQEPMEITSVKQSDQKLNYTREGNVYYVDLMDNQAIGEVNEISIRFNGKPPISDRPPWSGGFTWTKDENGNDFIATTCQGEGASTWWPCKDHLYDEPDSVLLSITIPEPLTNISNGRLLEIIHNPDSTNTSHWFVCSPINNYGITVNIGNFVHFSESYKGINGPLDCDYYVLPYNLEKAKKQFKQVPMMLEAFEYWFGPYPFYEDGYKLVEAPYLGMEHQSAVSYGNLFTNGYWGMDLSGTGWGLKFDYIIIHESGHEWFGNNISVKDLADLWLHEGFTDYSESLYLDYHFGKKASSDYVIGIRRNIQNDKPLIGPYNVNHMNTHDIYYKGANLLHTLRQLIEDDELWRNILVKMNQEFYHQTVTSDQIEKFLSRETNKDLTAYFNQYLRDTRIPTLEYEVDKKSIRFRWTNIVENFDMPIRVNINSKEEWVFPNADWKSYKNKKTIHSFSIDPNFYVFSENLNAK